LNLYDGSHIKALLDVYPGIGLIPSSFQTTESMIKNNKNTNEEISAASKIRTSHNKQRSWSSGMMLACHAGDPGSTPGGRIFLLFINFALFICAAYSVVFFTL
jgi:hypothetical protein